MSNFQPTSTIVLAFAVSFTSSLVFAADLDLDDPAVAMDTWIRLKSDTAERVTYEWMTGMVFGVPDGETSRPLFAVESVTKRQSRRNETGIFEERNFACRLYKDAETGEFIDSWDNPFTGERVDLNVKCNAGIPVSFPDTGMQIPEGIPYESSAIDAPMELFRTNAGDHVILRHENHAIFTTGTGEVRPELSIDTFKLKADDLNDPSQTALFPAYSWTSNTRWMSIFGMQDTPGHMIWDLHGVKFLNPGDLPAPFRAALDSLEPGILDKPIDWSN